MRNMTSPVEKIAYSISAASRKRKFDQFLHHITPKPHETIVDVGVNTEEYSDTDNYLEKFYAYPDKITAVALGDLAPLAKRYPHIRTVLGDGRKLSFPDNTFDIAYSNAVIEHVGNRDDQKQFLSELYRVSSRGYLTTPNRLFPVEIHTRVPLLHLLLSKEHFDVFLKYIKKSWATGSYMTLLSEKELRDLLKEADINDYQLIKNRFFGWPMTFTVIWQKS